jgi:hypothetical protein
MITAIIITDAVVDVMGSTSSHATIIVTPELLLERYVQLHQLLSHFLKLSF